MALDDRSVLSFNCFGTWCGGGLLQALWEALHSDPHHSCSSKLASLDTFSLWTKGTKDAYARALLHNL
jgi:hypothetical protein